MLEIIATPTRASVTSKSETIDRSAQNTNAFFADRCGDPRREDAKKCAAR
jgi:hypothetical protein